MNGRSLPALKSKRVLAALKRFGFYIDRITGSHYILKHPGNRVLRVTLPYHSRDLKRKTLESIIEQAGLSVEQFLNLL